MYVSKWISKMKCLISFLTTIFGVFLLSTSLQPVMAQSVDAQPTDVLITGRVTDEETGEPLANINIVLPDSSFPVDSIGFATTDSAGYYTITKVLGNRWWVLFASYDNDTYFGEYYNNVPLPAEGSPYSKAPEDVEEFFYTPGQVYSDINASLTKKGNSQIKGRVTSEPDGAPLASVAVEVYDSEGKQLSWYTSRTNANGEYTVRNLRPGTYKLRYNYESWEPSQFYITKFYGGGTDLDNAQPILVEANDIIESINITLSIGGAITGFVTSESTGAPVIPRVSVYDQSNRLVTVIRGNDTDYSYLVPNLAPGQYRLFFEDQNGKHRAAYYNHKASLEEADPITVQAGIITPGIDIALIYTPTVVSIATSKALPNTIVIAVDDDPAPRITMDGGLHWQSVATTPWEGSLPPYSPYFYYTSLGLSPREELSGRRILYARVNNTYRSGDLGASWSSETPHYNCPDFAIVTEFGELVQSPIVATTLYFIETCRTYSEGLNWFSGLFASTDGGVSWQQRSVISDTVELQRITAVVPSPVITDRLYIAQEYGQWYQSDDGGETVVFREDISFDNDMLVPDTDNADLLYGLQTRYGPPYYRVGTRSEDGGKQWVDWAQQPCPNYGDVPDLLVLPGEGDMLFLTCRNNIYRSSDKGDHWTLIYTGAVLLLRNDLGVPGRLLMGRSGELWASSDQGNSWQLLMNVDGESPYQNYLPIYMPSISAP